MDSLKIAAVQVLSSTLLNTSQNITVHNIHNGLQFVQSPVCHNLITNQ